MTWYTANVLAVFLDCDIWVHHQYFFGNIHSFPVISPMGTSQSHDLEHCECTVHVPAGVITGKLSGKFKMYLQCPRWVCCWYTVHFLLMSLQCSWWEHHHLPPVSDTFWVVALIALCAQLGLRVIGIPTGRTCSQT